MSDVQTIFVVDDDQVFCSSLSWLLGSLQLNVRCFYSALQFLSNYDPDQPGCLVLDVRMPNMSGLSLQETLVARKIKIPIILVSGHGNISMAVQAMKAGAVDFIEKPFNDQLLLERIQQCLALDTHQRREAAKCEKIIERLGSLTPREAEVLDGVVNGKPNKLIAAELGISAKTVEVYRARFMEKMAAKSVAELVALVIASGYH